MHPRNTGHKTASVVGWGGGEEEGRQAGADGDVGSEAGSGGGGSKKGNGKTEEK